jgi:hypothetical protein
MIFPLKTPPTPRNGPLCSRVTPLSGWGHWRDYVVRANAGTDPAAQDTYPDHHTTTGTRDFWNTHWAAISAVEQVA